LDRQDSFDKTGDNGVNIGFSLLIVGVLILLGWAAVAGAGLVLLFGAIIPYAAFLIFIAGFVYRVVRWGRSPVPFRIPTTCGQQRSLPWIRANPLESPYTTAEVLGRMALEVFLFRSLFRNTKLESYGQGIVYGGAKWLWLAGMAFHWSFLFIVLRHLRFFIEPVLPVVNQLSSLDGFFEIGVPTLYLTDALILTGISVLFLRRVLISHVRYISLPADYFPLFLIFGIATSGVLMRHFFKVDLLQVKELAIGLVRFHPVIPEGIAPLFYIHLFLVCVLLAYFPMSKLMHMGGVFLSPTRNLANNNRSRRHINPWNAPVKVHTYEEYEEEFRDKMKAAGLPIEKE
jgi:nitrate reductase gamma subunit